MGEREAIARDPFVQYIGKTGSALLCLRLSDGRSRGVKHYWLAVCTVCVIIYLATLMPMTAIDCQQICRPLVQRQYTDGEGKQLTARL